MGRGSATSLAPGFRFHPTDEELVRYYLKRKVCSKPLRFDHISVIDIYKSEPWDLPDKSKLKSRDLEWYFFSMLDKKYGNGSRTNRATEKGYWKTTGKDREIRHHSQAVGMKKTLVYHKGRAPRGERSNWVMHEYRLVDQELEKAGVVQDAFVLCRIFQKSGTGPKNGEQYGAPFVEEEWEDDDMVLAPGQDAEPDQAIVGEDSFVEANYIDQNLDSGGSYENTAFPLNFYHGESSHYVESGNHIGLDNDSGNQVGSGNYIEQTNHIEQSKGFSEDDEKPMIGIGEVQIGSGLNDGQIYCGFPKQKEVDVKFIKEEYVAETSHNDDLVGVNYLLEEPYLDATDDPLSNDGFFLEANDLTNPIEDDYFDFEEYLSFFDDNDGNSQNVASDPCQTPESGTSVSDQAPLVTQKNVSGGEEQVPMGIHYLVGQGNNDASSSKENSEPTKLESGVKYSFLKQASHMLGSHPAPPALASEFPTKEAVLRLNALAQTSGSAHVTAGMIRISSMPTTRNGLDWSYGKNRDINAVLSFTFPEGNISNSFSLVPTPSLPSGKTGSLVSWSLFFLIFFWVLLLPASFKMGTSISTRQC